MLNKIYTGIQCIRQSTSELVINIPALCIDGNIPMMRSSCKLSRGLQRASTKSSYEIVLLHAYTCYKRLSPTVRHRDNTGSIYIIVDAYQCDTFPPVFGRVDSDLRIFSVS